MKGLFRMSKSVPFWYRLISRSATTPGRHLWGFLTLQTQVSARKCSHTHTHPPCGGADFRAALVAKHLRGALPPVDLRAVCLVRAYNMSMSAMAGGTTPSRPTSRTSITPPFALCWVEVTVHATPSPLPTFQLYIHIPLQLQPLPTLYCVFI
jgi:hypothetical protein